MMGRTGRIKFEFPAQRVSVASSLTPLAVLTGFALNLGTRAFLCSAGTAAMMSTSRGLVSSEYFDANRVLTRF